MFSLRSLQGRSKVAFSLEGSESIVVSEAYQVIEDFSSSGISDQFSHSVCVCVCVCVCVHVCVCTQVEGEWQSGHAPPSFQ